MYPKGLLNPSSLSTFALSLLMDLESHKNLILEQHRDWEIA